MLQGHQDQRGRSANFSAIARQRSRSASAASALAIAAESFSRSSASAMEMLSVCGVCGVCGVCTSSPVRTVCKRHLSKASCEILHWFLLSLDACRSSDLIALITVHRETPAACAACAGDMCEVVCRAIRSAQPWHRNQRTPFRCFSHQDECCAHCRSAGSPKRSARCLCCNQQLASVQSNADCK